MFLDILLKAIVDYAALRSTVDIQTTKLQNVDKKTKNVDPSRQLGLAVR
jgi:hypothetical protein